MQKLSFTLLGFLISIALGICVMIFGWGLSPISWGWVIWGSIGSALVGALIMVGGE